MSHSWERVSWTMKKIGPGHFEGFVILPVGFAQLQQARDVYRATGHPPTPRQIPPGARTRDQRKLAVKAKGSTAAGAMKDAASVAEKIISNPIVSSMLPPGSGAAVKGIKMLASTAAAGKLASGVEKLVGPGAKRLGKALLSFF